MPNLLPSALRDAVDLAEADLDWIHQLVADWQLIADLSTSDLVLWVRTRAGRFIAAGHTRPCRWNHCPPRGRYRAAHARLT